MKDVKGFFGDFFFLSNFFECIVPHKGLMFPSSEHAFMYSKLKDGADDDKHQYNYILTLTPSQVKKWGRQIDLRPDWNNVRIEIMYAIVESKFRHNKELHDKLILIDGYIEETNTWGDKFWGVCNGVGRNHLGNILMKLRNKFTLEKTFK